MSLYELLILGSPTMAQRRALEARIADAATAFELTGVDELALRGSADANIRDHKAATAALYFGGAPFVDTDLISELQSEKIPIIPIIKAGGSFSAEIPTALQATNGYFIPAGDVSLEPLAAVWLECVGLLQEQRRVFVSYRRTESREVAVQLHDQLSARGFDVFLDTHDIRPGQPFQDKLWHRLVDCDVVIVLDTPDYFGSKWTTQEFGRAAAKGIYILRLVWPGHTPTRHLDLSETIVLTAGDFRSDNTVEAAVIDQVIRRTEHLRSRSIATRHLSISGKLRIEVERAGGRFEGVGAYRSMALVLPSGKRIWAYPVVGVPTADLLNDIHSRAIKAAPNEMPFLVYDHVGIQDVWLDHLDWLNDNIPVIKGLRVVDAAWELIKWDS